jgi:hypothetical protein
MQRNRDVSSGFSISRTDAIILALLVRRGGDWGVEKDERETVVPIPTASGFGCRSLFDTHNTTGGPSFKQYTLILCLRRWQQMDFPESFHHFILNKFRIWSRDKHPGSATLPMRTWHLCESAFVWHPVAKVYHTYSIHWIILTTFDSIPFEHHVHYSLQHMNCHGLIRMSTKLPCML